MSLVPFPKVPFRASHVLEPQPVTRILQPSPALGEPGKGGGGVGFGCPSGPMRDIEDDEDEDEAVEGGGGEGAQ